MIILTFDYDTYSYTVNRQECFGCFSGMMSSCNRLQNVNKSSGAHFQMLLRQFANFFIFLDIQMGLIIIKYRRRAVYFNNQKTLHLIYKIQTENGRLSYVPCRLQLTKHKKLTMSSIMKQFFIKQKFGSVH